MLALLDISLADCNLHFTNSVGHKTKLAKNAADEPANAFWKELSWFISCFELILHIAFWHRPYDMKSTAFSKNVQV